MGKYIVKRVLLLIPTIFIVCAIVFALMRMVPGDAVDIIVNRMTQSGLAVDADAIRARLGLDVPAIQQFFNWLWDVVRLDLGGTLVLVALLGLAGPTLFGVSMLNTRIHGAVGEVQDKVRRRRES